MSEQRQLEQAAAEQPYVPDDPLTDEEKEGIILAVKSAFLKLKNLYDKITPVFDEYGFKAPWPEELLQSLHEVPGWALADLGAAFKALASTLFVACVATAAALFTLLVDWRRRGAGVLG